MAKAAIDNSWFLGILAAIGCDIGQAICLDGSIEVPVDQAVLDAAIASYDHPAFLLARQTESNRARRNELLAECDWTQLPDAPLSAADQANWQIYRQALRDVMAQPDMYNVTWPVPPA